MKYNTDDPKAVERLVLMQQLRDKQDVIHEQMKAATAEHKDRIKALKKYENTLRHELEQSELNLFDLSDLDIPPEIKALLDES